MARKPAAPAETQAIAVRTKTDLKQRLERAAAAAGRSLATEVELRLESTFADTHNTAMSMEEAVGFFALHVGGEHNLAFALAVGALLQFYESMSGKSWRANDSTKAEVERLLLDQIPRWLKEPPVPIDRQHVERFEKLWTFLLKNAPRSGRVGDFGDQK
jgi:hypothetical protein